jgi:activator of HSP90 ATPase
MGDMKNNFTLTTTFHAKPSKIYKAWLSTAGHTSMTGSPAKVDGREGGDFTAWDGYIWGTFLELDENKRIVQSWRTSEFTEEHEDSHVEIYLEETQSGTKLTLVHTKVPEGQNGYIKGWEDFYFTPMKAHFK